MKINSALNTKDRHFGSEYRGRQHGEAGDTQDRAAPARLQNKSQCPHARVRVKLQSITGKKRIFKVNYIILWMLNITLALSFIFNNSMVTQLNS